MSIRRFYFPSREYNLKPQFVKMPVHNRLNYKGEVKPSNPA
ncbi:hypothetical protein SZ54_3007 [Rhizobium sp. UR51a]|nr:hypothetical protein SZ54_3007 [Rhizobium sp. UR51a]